MPARGTHLTARTVTLTPKQREVMSLLAKGLTNYEISQALGLSLDGAKYHVGEILARLGVETREAAVKEWRRHTSLPERLRRGLLTIPMVLAARFATAVAVVVVIAGAAAIAIAIVLDGDGSTPAAPADRSPTTYPTPSTPDKGPDVLWRWNWSEPSARIWLTAGDDVVALAVSGPTAVDYTPHAGAVVLLDATSGSERWRFDTPARAFPAVVTDDLVIAGTADGTVYALDHSTGSERWRLSFPGTPFQVLDAGSAIVVASIDPAVGATAPGLHDPTRNGGHIWGIDPATGVRLWEGGAAPFSGAGTSAGTVVHTAIGRPEGYAAVAHDARSGAELWRVAAPQLASPPVVAGDAVWLFGQSGELLVVDVTTGTDLRVPTQMTDTFSCPATFSTHTSCSLQQRR